MQAHQGSAAQMAPVRAASTRRLSKRDLRELVRLTHAMQVTAAPAFERYGVTVHLPHSVQQGEPWRSSHAQQPTAAAGAGRQAGEAPLHASRTPRQQRRYGRGQRAAQQRRNAKKAPSLEENLSSPNPLASGERSAEASTVFDRSVPDVALSHETRKDVASADGWSAGAQQQQQLSQQPTACPNMASLWDYPALESEWPDDWQEHQVLHQASAPSPEAAAADALQFCSSSLHESMEMEGRAKHARSPAHTLASPQAKRSLYLRQDARDSEAESPYTDP